mgnify:CR=1 FL=1
MTFIKKSILFLSLISVVSCSAEETPSAPPISDITIDNFPIIDGSDSTDPLRTILMCKILGFNYKWERRPFTQEPGADIKMIVPEYTCSEDCTQLESGTCAYTATHTEACTQPFPSVPE